MSQNKAAAQTITSGVSVRNLSLKPKLTAQQVAAILGRPVGTIWSLTSRRQIPHTRITPRLVVYDQDEIAAWLEAKRVPVTGEVAK